MRTHQIKIYRLAKPDTKIVIGDCRKRLKRMGKGAVNCVFADPPFNIGVDYGVWSDSLEWPDYLDFTYEWLTLCIRALKRTGSLFVWLPSRLVSHVDVFLEDHGLSRINHLIIVQKFGQYRDSNFIEAHSHLLYFAKSPSKRTWNPDDILVPSDRATKYGDARTQTTKRPGMRVPLDVWGLDERYFGRVQGNNGERRPLHPNQVPEAVLFRILLATTNPGDLVLDPFAGSGTTGTVARSIGRRSIGVEINPEFARSAFERIREGPARIPDFANEDR